MQVFYKKLTPLLSILFSLFLFPLAAFAQRSIQNPIAAQSFTELLNSILDYAVLIVGPLAVLAILWAGFLFMTSGGDVEKVKRAKQALTWAVVGLAIVLTARGITYIIQDILKIR